MGSSVGAAAVSVVARTAKSFLEKTGAGVHEGGIRALEGPWLVMVRANLVALCLLSPRAGKMNYP